MKNYAKPNMEIVKIGNEADILTASPANDNIFTDGEWDLGNLANGN